MRTEVGDRPPLRTEEVAPAKAEEKATAYAVFAFGKQRSGGDSMTAVAAIWQDGDLAGAATSLALGKRPREQLLRMAEAANEVVAIISELHAAGSNLVLEALRGSEVFTEWEHYPTDDARDPATYAQYYLHAHSSENRATPDYAHFHTFMGTAGAANLRSCSGSPEADHPAHLVAISMNRAGMPERLFTTNRWVTGEAWYSSADVIAMVDRFVITGDQPSGPLNRWLSAMLVLFRPQIESLLRERDQAITAWGARHPDVEVFEDRRLDITSSIEISLERHLAWLEQQLDG
ncbi:MAG: hypothetical protein QHD01_07065 [Bradyrhizobium sp.]|uniref:DUF6969 family protein n=1 Tax=Bradyrhizobium sp. TaxID=376 RepID=UPI0029AC3BAF|nr:hypothetical protein [Bradyrhizobium sp.]MDX3966343.1 hypothetical protein [Bradyrhizobium sp.]